MIEQSRSRRLFSSVRPLILAFALMPALACSQQAVLHNECPSSSLDNVNSITKCRAILPFASSGRTQKVRSYPGIPSPVGLVPTAIMPEVPSGANRQAFPYDPRTIAPSVPASWPAEEEAGAYFVDRYHPDATDTNNPFGYPNKPRVTIPSSARGPNASYVEIHGSGREYKQQSPEYRLGRNEIVSAGQAQAPAFWLCVGGPWIGGKVSVRGQHVIFDGCKFQNEDTNPTIPHITIGPGAQFVTLRNNEFRGQGTPIGGGTGQIINIAGQKDELVEFVMIYNNVISGGGDWTADHKKDIHAVRPLYWARYIWILENDISHVQGDLIQTGNSSNRNPDPAQRSHYIYIGGNHLYEAFENALDNKNSFHVILSSNEIHDFGNARTGTAVILSNNDEGRYTGYHWAVYNEIYNVTGGAIRFSGDQDGEKTFAVGNYIHNVDDGIRLADHSGTADHDSWVVGNTIRNCTNRGIGFGRGAGTNLYVRSNTTIDCWEHVEDRSRFKHAELSNHWSFNSNGSRTHVSTSSYDVVGRNSFDRQSVVADESGVDSDPVYRLFESIYGVSLFSAIDDRSSDSAQ